MAFAPRGFTTLELLLVIAFFGIMTAITSVALTSLQPTNALNDGALTVVDNLRRAQIQAMAGLDGDQWGIHLSDSDGCFLPATKLWVFRGAVFDSATTTVDDITLPAGSWVTDLSIGGGCDVKFSRFDGSTTSTGTVTISNTTSATTSATINAYGRISTP